jgi:hypothetical protein
LKLLSTLANEYCLWPYNGPLFLAYSATASEFLMCSKPVYCCTCCNFFLPPSIFARHILRHEKQKEMLNYWTIFLELFSFPYFAYDKLITCFVGMATGRGRAVWSRSPNHPRGRFLPGPFRTPNWVVPRGIPTIQIDILNFV